MDTHELACRPCDGTGRVIVQYERSCTNCVHYLAGQARYGRPDLGACMHPRLASTERVLLDHGACTRWKLDESKIGD